MRIKIEPKTKKINHVEKRKKTCLSEEGERGNVTHLRENTAGLFTISQSRKIAATITKSTTPPVTRHVHRNFGIKFAVFVVTNVRDV